MKSLLAIQFIMLPTAVFAHVGHLGDLVGHDHWLGAAAIGTAIAIGLWTSLKGSKKSDEDQVEDLDLEEGQEA